MKVIVVESSSENNDTLNEDNGPNRDADRSTEENNLPCTGYVDNGGMAELSETDDQINTKLCEAVDNSVNCRNINVAWPSIGQRAVSEYSDQKNFARAFPWLFPGGLGDPKSFPQSLGEWGSVMLFYEDARFACDSIFPFFALNYIIRHHCNSSSGGFFINKFHQYCPGTLEELKQKIQEGDTSFIIHSCDDFDKPMKTEL